MCGQRRVVLFIAVSLDGYIATENEQLDWLFEVDGEGDNGISAFYETVDTVLMGRKTYDWVKKETINEGFPYQDKRTFVFTNQFLDGEPSVQRVHEDLESFVNQLKQESGKNIWLVGGGELVSSFLKADLLDEITVTVAPKLIGKGVRLFPEMNSKHNLSLKQVQTFNQFVELHYVVDRL
ncbi:dihydrofolate reductase [Geomicrobium sp. JCM 19037]|uniref:dihydrofolate reductase family protein n=1 Tax=Geomicrobium sp. JCM 19037 TaxID=1460634 RepID=UPI00045F4351|nr:dihydrofolate reductase family protein [Geomicrobium sp. JCM 19037]GAK03610.1 dihydrofolate reductase [Geomicrobium sp. JCM 19037]